MGPWVALQYMTGVLSSYPLIHLFITFEHLFKLKTVVWLSKSFFELKIYMKY